MEMFYLINGYLTPTLDHLRKSDNGMAVSGKTGAAGIGVRVGVKVVRGSPDWRDAAGVKR
jgi:hypothetical protein